MAQDIVRDQIKNSSGGAVVMDLDETVLDNSLYQVEPSCRIGVTQDSWSVWVKREEAGLVPGPNHSSTFYANSPSGLFSE